MLLHHCSNDSAVYKLTNVIVKEVSDTEAALQFGAVQLGGMELIKPFRTGILENGTTGYGARRHLLWGWEGISHMGGGSEQIKHRLYTGQDNATLGISVTSLLPCVFTLTSVFALTLTSVFTLTSVCVCVCVCVTASN